MEYNSELEHAEIELKNTLREERERKKQIGKDRLIKFAAGVYLIAGFLLPIYFMFVLILSMLSDNKESIATLLLILIAGMVSLGTAFGLYKILELSELQKKQSV